jgi:hypothetical protein
MIVIVILDVKLAFNDKEFHGKSTTKAGIRWLTKIFLF